MKNIDAAQHTRGESVYLDDISLVEGTLFLSVFTSPIAHGKINSIDISGAANLAGVKHVLLANDISGENQIGGILPDEPLLAEDEVHFIGMPIALVLAENEYIARDALNYIQIDITPLPVITCPREAVKQNQLIIPPRTFNLGDIDASWDKCEHIIEGKADSGGQEHLYIETNGAYAIPLEHGSLKVYSSTQGPTAVQRSIARVLGVPMHKIEIDVTRLGGGFGGKEDQATPWAVMVSLASTLTKKPVKISVSRHDDLKITGKRHPYSSDFKIGLTKDLRIIAYETTFYQNAGAAADLSPAVMERTLFHSTNSYSIPNTRVTAYSCKTNLPPNTAFRGFGGPQGMFVIEAAIAEAAEHIGVLKEEIQKKNLLSENDMFPYGQIAKDTLAHNVWESAESSFNLSEKKNLINTFNTLNHRFKKGYSYMPICFGISFTKLHMNQARALLHIYHDGSVGISTGAVEMGQGVNTKMLQVAQTVFSISSEKIKLESTNTTRVSNTSPSAASSTADLNGKAVEIAAQRLKERLLTKASELLSAPFHSLDIENEYVTIDNIRSELSWNTLVEESFLSRICLTENGHYATPQIHFDTITEKGHPFAYHVYGTAFTSVTIDCLLGTYEIDDVYVVHDIGQCMNNDIDLGQLEGGIVQGIGWMTMEDLRYDETGKLLSNSLSTYKVPDVFSVPKTLEINLYESGSSRHAILKSKAVGEPPLMYGIGAYFAIQNAVKQFNANYKLHHHAPFTPEDVLMSLYTTENAHS